MNSVGTRILTVEDDERIRQAVTLALEEEGWDVIEAGNGESALEAFAETPADVVLIDIMLPGIDGFEVCRSIRRGSDVPIIMVTARSDTHDVVAGLEAGADDYLTKPFAPKELSARIRAMLRRARSSESNCSSNSLLKRARSLAERCSWSESGDMTISATVDWSMFTCDVSELRSKTTQPARATWSHHEVSGISCSPEL